MCVSVRESVDVLFQDLKQMPTQHSTAQHSHLPTAHTHTRARTHAHTHTHTQRQCQLGDEPCTSRMSCPINDCVHSLRAAVGSSVRNSNGKPLKLCPRGILCFTASLNNCTTQTHRHKQNTSNHTVTDTDTGTISRIGVEKQKNRFKKHLLYVVFPNFGPWTPES